MTPSTNQDLHDALHRLADGAPGLDADPDTAWRHGVRRRRTTRAGAVVATVAVFALVLGAIAWLPGRLDGPPVASSSSSGADFGVPDRLYAVPDRFTGRVEDGAWSSDEVSDDLAVGRSAAAFVAPDGVPVVVGAVDGDYHLLDLPGFLGNDSSVERGLHGDEISVALSPDGRSLAYGWAEVGPDAVDAPVPSGVRVLDLDDGSVRSIGVPGREGTQAVRFAWSPDGTWLVWSGWQQDEWTPTSIGGSAGAAGLIAPGSTRSTPVETPDRNRVVGVDDAGQVRPTPASDTGASAPDGTVALAASGSDEMSFGDSRGRLVDSSPVDGVTGGPADLEPLGWVGDEAAVVLASPASDDDARLPQLLLVGPDVPAREIGRVDGAPQGLSLATDLMSLDRPTVERPAPDWPWSTTRWVLTGLGVALLLGVGWLIVVDRRRRALGGPLRGTTSAAEPRIRDDRFGPVT